MTRTIPPSLAPVLEQLELNAEELVTTERLDELVQQAGIRTATRVVAARLRERGWLLETGQRGVWEFAPAAVAGAYSRGGPTRLLRSVLARLDIRCGLTFQAAAWALGAADRAPARPEVAIAQRRDNPRMPAGLDVYVFAPALPYRTIRRVPTLQPASVIAHMATSPNHVRSWTSAIEWLPEIAAETTPDDLKIELEERPATVTARAGYLLQGMRPDIAACLKPPATKSWFGPRQRLKRHDNYWNVADTLLPFEPRKLSSVAP